MGSFELIEEVINSVFGMSLPTARVAGPTSFYSVHHQIC